MCRRLRLRAARYQVRTQCVISIGSRPPLIRISIRYDRGEHSAYSRPTGTPGTRNSRGSCSNFVYVYARRVPGPVARSVLPIRAFKTFPPLTSRCRPVMRVITSTQIDTTILDFVIKSRPAARTRLISRIYSIVSTLKPNGTGLVSLTRRCAAAANGKKRVVSLTATKWPLKAIKSV